MARSKSNRHNKERNTQNAEQDAFSVQAHVKLLLYKLHCGV